MKTIASNCLDAISKAKEHFSSENVAAYKQVKSGNCECGESAMYEFYNADNIDSDEVFQVIICENCAE